MNCWTLQMPLSITKIYGVASIVFVSMLFTSSLEETFEITRSVDGSNGEFFYNSRDKFLIGATNCSKFQCSQFNAKATAVNCFCKCTLTKPSFVYENGKWGCDADKIPIAEGCGFSTTPVFYLGASSTTTLVVPLPNVPCEVNETASRYLDCDGTWKPIGERGRFQMKEASANVAQKTYELVIRAATGVPDIKGRIIKLVPTCKPTNGNPCMVFKITGTTNCPVNPILQIPTPQITKENPPLRTQSRALVTEFPFHEVTPSMTTTTSTNTSNRNALNKRKKSDINMAAILAGVLSAIVVLIICFIVVFILRRQKRLKRASIQSKDPENKAQNGSQNLNDMFSHANPIYAERQQKRLPAKIRPAIPSFMRYSRKGNVQINHPKPPVKPRKNKRVGGSKVMSDFAARLRNSLASTENLPKEQTISPERKKPIVPPKPVLKPSHGVEDESDDFYDYDSDEWDSFSEPETYDNKGIDLEKVVSNPSNYRNPNELRSASKSQERSGQEGRSGSHIYEETFEGQKSKGVRVGKSEPNQSCSGISADVKPADHDDESKEDKDDYDEPEHVIIT